jgi:mandelate racemase
MARPLGTSAQVMRTAPLLLIDLDTEEGVTGHAYLFCYMPMAPGLIAAVLGDIEDAVRGERLAPIDFSNRLWQRHRLLGAQGIVRSPVSMSRAGMRCPWRPACHWSDISDLSPARSKPTTAMGSA